jgi:hypothetical protein
MTMKEYRSGAVIRGRYIDTDLVSFGGRSAGIEFMSPDPKKLLPQLPLGNPTRLADLYGISFDDIVDYLDELGKRCVLAKNGYLQEALEAVNLTAYQTPSLIEASYESMCSLFRREVVREMADNTIGIRYLEGWNDSTLVDGRTMSVRAFGARSLHIIAGNSPAVAALSLIRNAITRSDMIVKSPSNDPFTALAIVRTMIEMAPDHPITRHVSVAYWKGGDEAFEQQLYQPHNVEKIVAWGGFASVKHVTKYLQPGMELITLDPKRSASIIGPEAFADEETQRNVAMRLASDIGALNQEGCLCARVVYVLSGTDDAGLERLNRFGQHVYDALMSLPDYLSTKPKTFDSELKSNVRNAKLNDDWYKVFGGEKDEGAIIVSQMPEPVEFSATLANRVANLVPIDSIDEVYGAINSYTQTVGIYPESLRKQLRDTLPLYGAQRLVDLGFAALASMSGPQDGTEPLRRMCKWIIEENSGAVPFLWEDKRMFRGAEEMAL